MPVAFWVVRQQRALERCGKGVENTHVEPASSRGERRTALPDPLCRSWGKPGSSSAFNSHQRPSPWRPTSDQATWAGVLTAAKDGWARPSWTLQGAGTACPPLAALGPALPPRHCPLGVPHAAFCGHHTWARLRPCGLEACS